MNGWYSQPLREAVSWNIFFSACLRMLCRQPLREAVSWNVIKLVVTFLFKVSLFVRLWVEMLHLRYRQIDQHRQPLREAVSWNKCILIKFNLTDSQPLREAVSWNIGKLSHVFLPIVSLFVRLWVEILKYHNQSHHGRSASSWGCELKYPDRTHWNRNGIVSLFVRLWVEMLARPKAFSTQFRQPLREAVSWNTKAWTLFLKQRVSLFVRLWVEMYQRAVGYEYEEVSLFVRLWVEIDDSSSDLAKKSQPLREAVSWNIRRSSARIPERVSLFVRLWVEIVNWLENRSK